MGLVGFDICMHAHVCDDGICTLRDCMEERARTIRHFSVPTLGPRVALSGSHVETTARCVGQCRDTATALCVYPIC